MGLRNFPFDTERCLLKICLVSASSEFLLWRSTTVVYLREVLLMEYEVLRLRVRAGLLEGYSTALVTIDLHHCFGYYVTSAYLPMIMLMLISYTSLYCQSENRDLRVMMAITNLLILYALYQQMSEGLLPTLYTKAIDVWCSFSIMFIFS
ncbi:serotonin-gated chloride channel mod-1-like [Panulirus ornatus]|uniref:serotonin-gated chloride channel mod-1-like n=1 Tax=Panulirus ornatus TaxID=150431 RepID=UPI003A86D009